MMLAIFLATALFISLATAQDNSTSAATSAGTTAASGKKECVTDDCCTKLDCATCLQTTGCHFCDEVVKPKQPKVPPTCKMMCREGPTLNKCTAAATTRTLSVAAAAVLFLLL